MNGEGSERERALKKEERGYYVNKNFEQQYNF